MVDFYVLFGHPQRRSWEDGRCYGFVTAGGARRWSRPLERMRSGDRVFVNVPGRGYVGIGDVLDISVPIREAHVDHGGRRQAVLELDLASPRLDADTNDDELCEWVVPVRWHAAVPEEHGFWRRGLFSRRTSCIELTDRETIAAVCDALL
jgi:hypothetical protein